MDTRHEAKSPTEEVRRACEHVGQAGGAAAEMLVPPGVRHHLRAALTHLLRAGVAAMDRMEAQAQERSGTGPRSTPAAPSASSQPIAGSHTPECL